MEAAKKYLNQYKEPLMTGGLAVVLGFVAKKAMKMENISTNSFKQALGSFVIVSVAAVASQELEDRALPRP